MHHRLPLGTCPTHPPCSAALLVRPCIDLFKEAAPEVTTLIFTFLAFVFATAFTCASRGEYGVGWVGLQCQAGRLPCDLGTASTPRCAMSTPQAGAPRLCDHACAAVCGEQDNDRGVREAACQVRPQRQPVGLCSEAAGSKEQPSRSCMCSTRCLLRPPHKQGFLCTVSHPQALAV